MKLQKYLPKRKRLKNPIVIRTVKGHSMVPVLPPGTTVIGLAFFRSILPGDVVVVGHEGREKIKRVDEIKDDRIYLLGDHPETSTDSRHFGWVPIEMVIARIVWPKTYPVVKH